jgi:hypothetical protein
VRLALAGLGGVVLAVPTAAYGTVTIGSSLQHTVDASTSCVPNCTVALTALNPESQAAGGIVSPVDGTVTTWRITAGAKSGPTAFRVIRRLDGGTYEGAGTSPTVIPALETLNAYTVHIPIRRGDLIGIDCCASPGSSYFGNAGTGGRAFFEPGFLVDGGSGAMPSGSDTFETSLNADIEPTSTFTINRVRRKKGGRISVTARLPNAGTLAVGDPHDYALGAPGVKPLLLKPRVADVSPGSVTVTTRPTQRARTLLARRGRLKIHVKVLFTPTGGVPSDQTRKVKLNR